MNKKEKIKDILNDIFNRINIDNPSNFDDILKFVTKHVEENSDKENWTDKDVSIAFRKWLELN